MRRLSRMVSCKYSLIARHFPSAYACVLPVASVVAGLLPAFRALIREVVPSAPSIAADDSLLEMGADSLALGISSSILSVVCCALKMQLFSIDCRVCLSPFHTARFVEVLRSRYAVSLTLMQLANMPRLIDIQSHVLASSSAAGSGGGGSGDGELKKLRSAAAATSNMSLTAAHSQQVDWRAEIERASIFGPASATSSTPTPSASAKQNTVSAASSLSPSTETLGSGVLVTGCTGFLGAFLLDAVLRAPTYAQCKVSCTNTFVISLLFVCSFANG
jgi:hypothetical protein